MMAAIRLLEPAMAELVRIGGSHAQRELWEDTLIVAYLRGGHREKAAGLISARLERRPSARDAAWSRETAASGEKRFTAINLMKITIVAFEGCMTSAVFGQADAFALAAYIADSRADPSWSGHDIRIATPDGAAVQGFGGHRIDPHCSLHDARDSNVVLLPPILNDIEQTLMQESGLVSWLASFPARSTLLASTCTGAFLLAEAGVLDGRRVTTNPAFSALFQQRYPGVRLALDERIIDDNMVICPARPRHISISRSMSSIGWPAMILRYRQQRRYRSTAIRNRNVRTTSSSRRKIMATIRFCNFRTGSKFIITSRLAWKR